ncbi:MAG: aminopeptidase P N-terminal domain-containing protein [Candidatus Marinimicrobia bacterium]|nr:aminopeptidase P N-terminal domain-containing protein [Candidatus Neomarinimicrobiota bacterium]MCF7850866.1 aminopeptidase P N-terminal domain-containing protein [Candidatus Neomarinimicrobiota bacterium]MCF7904381.1 aminopeptidase P N-terminal domain-containing protein [Candidatus Neomarinimicrobiota bacterium]
MRIKLIVLIVIISSFAQGASKSMELPRDEFARRRALLLEELRELDAIAILHSAPLMERNHDVEYPYRQDSDFFYLTGWKFTDAILILTPQQEEDQAEVHLFVAPRVPKREVWTGPRKGVEEAQSLPGIDKAYPYAEHQELIPKLTRGYSRLVLSTGNNTRFQAELDELLLASASRPEIVQEAGSLLKTYRLIKSAEEIKHMEKAITITGTSLVAAFKQIPSLKKEYEVQAEIEYGFKRLGAERLGFPSIVGAGKHATYLHYEDKSGDLVDGDLILLDVGAEWEYYSADITRTVPVNGMFSTEQAKLYQLVLDAQKAAIAVIKPGIPARTPHKKAVEVITTGLVELGFLTGEVDELIAQREYRRYFMHGASHWLGLDVHDAGGYTDKEGEPLKLQTGMVLTVEPGIYISEPDDLDPKWWNIGIRIEDNVLVTKKGYRILSQSIPKEIREIESIMQP